MLSSVGSPLPPDADLADPNEVLSIEGARTHNLQNLHLQLPRNALLVITGVSGSGKSSLAFDTVYAEGQRRYLETFSTYVRQFVGGLERPDVDKIEGLSPVIAIDQKTTSRNPRSTVGTVTEVYDFLRLLFARASEAYSPVSGLRMEKLSDEGILQLIRQKHASEHIVLLAPVVRARKGHYREDLEKYRRQGYTRARIDGVLTELEPGLKLDRYVTHDIEVVVDRLLVEDKSLGRLTRSLTTALNLGKGSLLLMNEGNPIPRWYSRNLADPENGIAFDDPQPNTFSFNSPYGACKRCQGLGNVLEIDVKAVVIDERKSAIGGALAPLDDKRMAKLAEDIKWLARRHKFKASTPWNELEPATRKLILNGEPDVEPENLELGHSQSLYQGSSYIGLLTYLKLAYRDSQAEQLRNWAEQFVEQRKCPACHGDRLKPESLQFKLDHHSIADLARMDLGSLRQWFEGVEERLKPRQRQIAHELLKEIRQRLDFLINVGLDYLSLDRQAKTLSGGEAQRIRLATQIGSQLTGVLYILDEPSIGLHQRDNQRLIGSLKNLRDLGNTVLVVEHDEEMMLAADYLVDMGPGAGVHGGRVVAQGRPDAFLQQPSVTADYLSGRRNIAVPATRRTPSGAVLGIRGARGHNLQNVNADLPLGLLVCVAGVSGSGKSTLINHTLLPVLHEHVYGYRLPCQPYDQVLGLELIDKVIAIDQKPIGRTPRSNPATYTKLFDDIRQLFSSLPEAQIRGYAPGRFSFNVKGGRCETCGGGGVQVIEMNFLPDVLVDCPTCRGRRYNRETLEVRYRGKSIADVLDMTIEDAAGFFDALPRIAQPLRTLNDVGLGYVRLGQSATTLSGGEAQRMKLSAELSKKSTGRTVYLLDEPTTGLHFSDIQLLLDVLNRLVDRGNTVIVIEHNLDVVKVADWVLDMGPDGGSRGGRLVAQGTPEDVARNPDSVTGRFLKPLLERG